MKNNNIPLIISILTLIIGIAAWIPNLFFYSPDNQNISIFFTPIIGVIGIIASVFINNKSLKITMIILNILVTISFGIVMFFGTLFFGT
ncbi:hypothetical protein [Macrococcus carouselicus]|uniref:Uncharacterized protein n=1 Tax=Macrococcus carouselicus TaxID=69969 RepID=A0A9Q8CJC3_9STAP|nr:hypothetical protein [Macrococcus carouselicus]TDM02422.1 hypothetical protein ERX40_07660 [Macrococcus carouselicus]